MSHIDIPTATVLITGLAICKKRDDLRPPKWEVLFFNPRVQGKDHLLKIEVLEISAANPRGIHILQPKIVSGRKIAIIATNPKPPLESEHLHGKFIDPQDMVWCMNFRTIHSTAQLIEPPPAADIADLSYMTIENSQFYTFKRTEKDYELKRGAQPQVFNRQIAEKLGANIDCEDGGEVQIKLDDRPIQGLIRPLRKMPDIRYEIILTNLCNGPDEIDFKHYYKIYNVSESERFNLRDTSPDVSLDAACNPIKGDPNCNLELYYTEGKCSQASTENE